MKSTVVKSLITIIATVSILACSTKHKTNVTDQTAPTYKTEPTTVDDLNKLEREGYIEERKKEDKVKVLAPKAEYDENVVNEYWASPSLNTESYQYTPENNLKNTKNDPLSTFSIDVDEASYTNCRRYLQNGSLPPTDAIRIEEFINYFDYEYAQPKDKKPFAVHTELGKCPWNENAKLLQIGIQGKKYDWAEIEPLNLVFLIDVSGSMSDENKLPLLQKSFKLLVKQLRPTDKVAIVVYAGAAGLVLPATSDKEAMNKAIENLSAGGSTAGGEGIELAYKIAKENLIKNGCNRVILATDGDFNVGASSDGEMTRLLENKRKEGIYLTTLGFGMGNYKDSKMESMADKGNGNSFYIDSFNEARKVLVNDLGSTLYTIAKDVKIQVEFNPNVVAAYRLIGYENRKLENQDFNDDTKDAGELGAGHTVTAFYEIIESGKTTASNIDTLKYQIVKTVNNSNAELGTVKLRYKLPNEETSNLITHVVSNTKVKEVSNNMGFAAAVTEFGLILRNSEFKGSASFENILTLAQANKGTDPEGYRNEFIQLVKTAQSLQKN